MNTKILIVVILAIGTVSCDGTKAHNPEQVSGPAAAVQTTMHKAVGVVKSLNPNIAIIEIQHDDIPGLMPAMTMQFHVSDRGLLANIAVGNHVEFTVENSVEGMRIVTLRKL
ncbi:MAG: copper-binding protein [Pyrinomonadaceae bacterium]